MVLNSAGVDDFYGVESLGKWLAMWPVAAGGAGAIRGLVEEPAVGGWLHEIAPPQLLHAPHTAVATGANQ